MIDAPVREYMQTDPMVVSPDTEVGDIAETMAAKGVGFCAVVEGGTLVGIVSESDLLMQELEGDDLPTPLAIPLLGDVMLFGKERYEDSYRRAFGATARDLMSEETHTVSPDTTVHEAARALARHDVSRLAVVEDGRVIGTFGRSDVVRALARVEF